MLALLALILIGTVYAVHLRVRSRRVAIVVDSSESMRLIGADSVSQRLARALIIPSGYHREVWQFADSTVPPNYRATVGEGRTRLQRAMERVLGSRPDAVVMLSDGQDNDEAQPPTTHASVPVYAVGFGAAARPNLAISSVSTPPTVAAGESLDVAVRILATNAQPGKILVHAMSEQRELTLAAGTSEQAVTFRIAFGRVGLQTVSATIESLPGESNYEDNTGSAVVDVRPARHQIVYVSGRPGAGSRFALAALREDDRIDTRMLTPFDPTVGQADIGSAEAFVLDEPNETGVATTLYARILQRVRAGASALVIAGPDIQGGVSLGELLGGALGPARPGTFVPELTTEGRATTLFGEETELTDVPPFVGIRELTSGLETSEVWLRARGTGLPLMGVRACGRGRVVYCAGYPIWRWGFGPSRRGATLLGTFLGRLAGYLSATTAEQFSLAASRASYMQDEPAVLRLRASGPTGLPWNGLGVRLSVQRTDSSGNAVSDTLSLMMVANDAGAYEARVVGAAPGLYRAGAVVVSDGAVVGRAVTEFVVREQSLERSRLGLNRSILADLVGQTGGTFWPYESLPSGGITIRPGVQSRKLSFDPRRMTLLYVVAALLAGAEWLLRRRRGLL